MMKVTTNPDEPRARALQTYQKTLPWGNCFSFICFVLTLIQKMRFATPVLNNAIRAAVRNPSYRMTQVRIFLNKFRVLISRYRRKPSVNMLPSLKPRRAVVPFGSLLWLVLVLPVVSHTTLAKPRSSLLRRLKRKN
jgi:hypothetical protein